MRRHPDRNNETGGGSSSSASAGASSVRRRRIAVPLVVFMILLLIALVVALNVMLMVAPHYTSASTPNQDEMMTNTLINRDQRPAMLRGGGATTAPAEQEKEESIQSLRKRLPPSVWTLAGSNADAEIVSMVKKLLTSKEQEDARAMCGRLLYSSLEKAVHVSDLKTFVATGDIDDMWTRDSAVQMGLYVGRMTSQKWLRLIVEGAIRRQAFYIIQDPYANAYEHKWMNPNTLPTKDKVIGRGGWVATRNYELDSGAYFMTQLWDYFVAEGIYRPEVLLSEVVVFEAVMLLVDTWVVEQHHDTQSPYRYFELPNQGRGLPTAYTGMSWSGFRPSDDMCQYGYLIPANIFAASGLERILELNKRIWHSDQLAAKASKLLKEIEDGIQKHGVVSTATPDGAEQQMYAYEVDGLGNVLKDFDDSNIPSLLSIPLLGWSKYDREVYEATRKRLIDPAINKFYFNGTKLKGMGSPHTPSRYVWPMAFVIEALTTLPTSNKKEMAQAMVFQMRQSLTAACHGVAHEGVHSDLGCKRFSRKWFEWSNALFVVLFETSMGERCDAVGQWNAKNASVAATEERPKFYTNPFKNNHKLPEFYQGIEAKVAHDE